MTLYDFKPRFQALLRPTVARLAARGVTANQVTVAAAAGSVLVGLAVAGLSANRHIFLLIPVWMLLRMALNAVDGMLAREHGPQSRLGGYLNELGDVVSDAALYAPFALLPAFGPAWVGLVVVLALIAEYAGVRGSPRHYDGPLGKNDRALVFGALGTWAGFRLPMPAWLGWLMPILALLLVATAVNRVRAGLRAVP